MGGEPAKCNEEHRICLFGFLPLFNAIFYFSQARRLTNLRRFVLLQGAGP